MIIRWKTIVLSLVALLAVGYLVGSVVWVRLQPDTKVCKTLTIDIQDEANRKYLTRSELITLLQEKRLYPIGKSVKEIDLQQIEHAIETHPMIRKAECYTRLSGEVVIQLSQRVPILRVDVGNESYFIDSDRKRMPIRASVTDKILPVVGNVGQRMASEEIADLVEWIQHDRYWHDKINKVYVCNPHLVKLVQSIDGTTILLGECKDYSRKMRRLQTLYEKGFEKIGWQTYREYDLRYEGQVIGRK